MATIIDGRQIAKKFLDEVSSKLKEVQKDHPDFKPGLAIVQVGNRSDSNVYIRRKLQSAADVGINAQHIKLSDQITEAELHSKIDELNEDDSIDGIILQMPLDSVHKIKGEDATDRIAHIKDVDGLTRENAGRLMRGELDDCTAPCTPTGCLHLVQQATGDINYVRGKRVVVVGRSNIVGAPAASLFMRHHGTVTTCHTKTEEGLLSKHCKEADIIIAAAGQRELIRGDWIKPGAVIIDCGINVNPETGKLCGDVCFEEAKKRAGFITPVPGGVGPMTVAMIIRNTVIHSIKNRYKSIITPTWPDFFPLKQTTVEPVPSDIEISRAQQPKPIDELARQIGIHMRELEMHGKTKAKVSLAVLDRLQARQNGKYVVITAITPTPFGEGKSTTTIGLAQGLCTQLGRNTFACVRQPSMGPTFGIKGGAAGGGYSQVIPMEEFNLHLTGDIHAIGVAHNLMAAAIDARMFHESTQSDEALFNRLVPQNKAGVRSLSKCQRRRLERLGINIGDDANELSTSDRKRFARLNIDPSTLSWNRVVDLNDRFLRKIQIGHGEQEKGHIRTTEFAITVSSELMAILALCTSLKDMKERISRIVVANDHDGNPITADDIGVAGALTVLMKDTCKPNLMQTLEGTPVFVHAGPFANIAHGSSSILADKVALKLVGGNGFVVTEAGFGADIGAEKFFDIKCRSSGLLPNAAVIVTTVRALKMHGGGPPVTPGAPLPFEYMSPNIELVRAGCDSNLRKHIENVSLFGVPIVVCVNRFSSDTTEELNIILDKAKEFGAIGVVSTHWAEGGKGAIELAKAVAHVCEKPSNFKFLYSLEESILQKIVTIADKIYGASSVHLSDEVAMKKVEAISKNGFDKLPICMAKTHLSLSENPALKGAPKDFVLHVRDVRVAVGAGFIFPLVGEITTMPGLSTRPCFIDIDIDPETELIEGLF